MTEVTPPGDLERVEVRLGDAEWHTTLPELCVIEIIGRRVLYEAWDTLCQLHPREDEGWDSPPHPAGRDPHV